MKKTRALLALGLLVAIGLGACQDEVVTPDIEVTLETAAKKPPKPDDAPFADRLMAFMAPDGDNTWPFGTDPAKNLDVSADPQIVEARPDLTAPETDLEFQADAYKLFLHFQDELNQPDSDWYPFERWCETMECDRSGCDDTQDFNVLQFLQSASDELTAEGEESGLVGRIHGYTYDWGFQFWTTIETGAAGYMDGHYWFEVCFRNDCGYESGEYMEGEYAGYEWWRLKNAPIKAWRKPLTSTKRNDVWTHRSMCGLFGIGPVHRGGSYEVFFGPEGG